jgi:PAS domain S-box-containing protein
VGGIAALIIGIVVYFQFYNIAQRYTNLTKSSYHSYIDYLSQDTLADMARYIEKQFPVLHDTERLKREARTEWFWEISRELTGIAKNFDFAYIYYVEKTDEGYIFLMSSGIGEDEHPEWLHGPVWAEETPPFIDEAWETQQPTFSTEPTINEWGTLISAELPIVNDGVVVGVLGIDYDITFLNALRQEEILLSEKESDLMRTISRVLIISAVFLILIIGIQMFIGYKWVLVPIQTREEEERTRIMLDATPLACFLLDKEGRVYDSTTEAVILFGAKSKAYLEEHFFDFMPETQPSGLTSRAEAMNRIHIALAAGRLRFEWTHRDLLGRLIPVEVTLVRVNWQEGFCIVAFVRDLTEIKATGQKIEEINNRVKIMLDATPMACSLRDENGVVLDCNQEAVNLFGVKSKSDFIEHYDGLSPEFQSDGEPSSEKATRLFSAAFMTGYQCFNWTYRTAMGGELPVETTLRRIPWENGFRIAAYSRDLRREKAYLAELEKALARAGENTKAKTDSLSNQPRDPPAPG